MALTAGTVLSHYRVDEMLGAGGMGVVYRATDLKLNRTIALKVIGLDLGGGDQRARFLKEARAASAFSHPNIVTIHEIDTAGDIDFIAMELLSGRSLDKRIVRNGLPLDEAVSVAEQIASALAAAHSAGIVHRDIKPANVMVSDAGHVTLLDFGIAKQLAGPAGADQATLTVADPTTPGAVIGSVPYMSPEQAQGHAIDARSDVFGFGVLLYEMLTGHRPFSGNTSLETVAKILEATPAAVEAIRTDVPLTLATLIAACLEKDRNRRPHSAEVLHRLAAIRQSRAVPTPSLGAALFRRAVVVPVALALALLAGAGLWWWESGRAVREARRKLPAVLELAARGDASAFYAPAAALIKVLPDDPQLRAAWETFTFAPPPLNSEPPGAEVLVKGYDAPESAWVSLGRTPIEKPRFPQGIARLKFVKDDYASYDGTPTIFAVNAVLDRVESVPSGMVRVPKGSANADGNSSDVSAFWMDRYEITNRQYKAFVDAGGYTKREYWQQPFVESGRPIAWEDAMARFLDRTGRAGPSTWELGTFAEGQADFPVGGVSWYEAAAFAAFAGKSLPTVYQWRMAADFAGPSGVFGDILVHSTFNATSPTAVGTLNNIGPYGQFDMAGNVKEWCWNESRDLRMILGGGFSDPKYTYEDRDAQPPFSRRATYGIRLVKNIDPQPAASFAPMPRPARDYAVEKPIDDAAFEIVKSLYAYDNRPLASRVDNIEELADWRRETVTFDAAYGNERVIAYVYLPKTSAPPYQTVIYFPGGDAQMLRSSRELNLTYVDFIVRSGRALVYPVYKGTFERGVSLSGQNTVRDVAIARVKDFKRTMEYIATRRDLDADRIGYYGVSMGAFQGILINALVPNLKATAFLGGGLGRGKSPAEIDLLNFVPRMSAPTLMVNGSSDFQAPLESAQRPLYRLLPMPAERKRHAQYDGGHLPNQINDLIREVLDWFDRFLGPVRRTSATTTTH